MSGLSAAERAAAREELEEIETLYSELVADEEPEDDAGKAELDQTLEELEEDRAECRARLGLPDLSADELDEIREEMAEAEQLLAEMKAEGTPADAEEAAESAQMMVELEGEVRECRLKLGLEFDDDKPPSEPAAPAPAAASADSPAVANLRAAVAEHDAVSPRLAAAVPASTVSDDESLRQLFEAADTNKSGQLDFDEFKRFLQKTISGKAEAAAASEQPEEQAEGDADADAKGPTPPSTPESPVPGSPEEGSASPERPRPVTPPPVDPELVARLGELKAKTPKEQRDASVKDYLATSASTRGAAAASDVDRVVEMRLWSSNKRGDQSSMSPKMARSGTPPRGGKAAMTPEQAKAEQRAQRAAFLQQQKRSAIREQVKNSPAKPRPAAAESGTPSASAKAAAPDAEAPAPSKPPPKTRVRESATPPRRRPAPEPEPEPEPEPDSPPISEEEEPEDAAAEPAPRVSEDIAAMREIDKELKRARKKFKQMDADGSGVLDGNELEELARWVFRSFHPGGEPLSEQQLTKEAAKLRQRLDANEDGLLDFDEFAGWFSKTCAAIYRFRRKVAKKPAREATMPPRGRRKQGAAQASAASPEPGADIPPRGRVDRTSSHQKLSRAVKKAGLISNMSGGVVHHLNRAGKACFPVPPGEDGADGQNLASRIATCLQLGIAATRDMQGGVLDFSARARLTQSVRNEPWVQNHELPPSRVTEYAANAFADIRRMYHIQTVAYKAALGMLDWSDSDASHVQTRLPDLRLVGAADAAGKSAAWFFFSADQRYILKLATTKELQVMLDILPDYHRRIQDARQHADAEGWLLPNTLLPQIYGMYTVSMDALKQDGKTAAPKSETHWLVMRNILGSGCKIHERYDLKGSVKGRHASTAERAKGYGSTLKCNDFRESRIGAGKHLVTGSAEVTASLKQALQRDVEFLGAHQLIDYSLLVGCHHKWPEWRPSHKYSVGDSAWCDGEDCRLLCVECAGNARSGLTGEQEPVWDQGQQVLDGEVTWRCVTSEAVEGETQAFELSHADRKTLTYSETEHELLFYGIIDILTRYTAKKKAEKVACGSMKCASSKISCQPPQTYAQRFQQFISSAMVEHGEELEALPATTTSMEDQAEIAQEQPATGDDEADETTELRRTLQQEEGQDFAAPPTAETPAEEPEEGEAAPLIPAVPEPQLSKKELKQREKAAKAEAKRVAAEEKQAAKAAKKLRKDQDKAHKKAVKEAKKQGREPPPHPADDLGMGDAVEQGEPETPPRPVDGDEAEQGVWVAIPDDPEDYENTSYSYWHNVDNTYLEPGEEPPEGEAVWWEIHQDGEILYRDELGNDHLEPPGGMPAAHDGHAEPAEHEEQYEEEYAEEELSDASEESEAEELEEEEEEEEEEEPAEPIAVEVEPEDEEVSDDSEEEDEEEEEEKYADEEEDEAEDMWLEKDDDDGNPVFVNLFTGEPRDSSLPDPEDFWVWDEESELYINMAEGSDETMDAEFNLQ